MTNCAEAPRRPDEQRLVDVASILAAGILRLRERQSLPVAKQANKPGDSSCDRLEFSGEREIDPILKEIGDLSRSQQDTIEGALPSVFAFNADKCRYDGHETALERFQIRAAALWVGQQAGTR